MLTISALIVSHKSRTKQIGPIQIHVANLLFSPPVYILDGRCLICLCDFPHNNIWRKVLVPLGIYLCICFSKIICSAMKNIHHPVFGVSALQSRCKVLFSRSSYYDKRPTNWSSMSCHKTHVWAPQRRRCCCRRRWTVSVLYRCALQPRRHRRAAHWELSGVIPGNQIK